MNDDLLERIEVAVLLGISVSTLEKWSSTRRDGPPFIKVGRLVRYRRSDVEQWLSSRRQVCEDPR